MNSPVESTSIELNLKKKKWLVNFTYSANNSNICDQLRSLVKSLDTFLTNYDKVFLMGNFNAEEAKIHIKDFCNLYKVRNLIKVPICFKKPDYPKIIDLMLTKSICSFQNLFETDLSDFRKSLVTVLKSYLKKKQPKIISYRDFGKFQNNDFRTQILRDFSILRLSNDSTSLDLYLDICIKTLDAYALKKKKVS